MNKILLMILFGIGFTVSTGVYAVVEQPSDFISKIHVQRALASSRQMIFTETVPNVCALSALTRVCRVEEFGVDKIDPDRIAIEVRNKRLVRMKATFRI